MGKKTKLIAIVGGIAVGKTTIGHGLLDLFSNMRFIEENVSKNEFLEDFYGDMKRWAFHSRMSTLAMIASNYEKGDNETDIILMDRCLDELITFARLQFEKGNLSIREFQVYKQLYTCLVSFAPKIDGYIYCYCDSKISMERIKKRNRNFEQGINISYIDRLNKEYGDWIESLQQENIYRVDTGKNVDLQKIKYFILNI